MNTKRSYCSTLENKLRRFPPKKKKERTRAALKLATANLLERVGYNGLRVAEIAKEAGVGTATFHDHFDNRAQAAKEVMVEFLDIFITAKIEPHNYSGPFANIYFSNKMMIDTFDTNTGLMNCILQLSEHDEEFTELWRRFSLQWYQLAADTIVDRSGEEISKSFMLMTIYSLGGMMDEFLRGIYLHKDSAILTVLKEHKIGRDGIAYFLSVLWYRAIFGSDPNEIPHEIKPETVTLFQEKLKMTTS